MTTTRIHIALGVRDIGPAVDFYRSLLGVAPSKLYDDYAKFEVADPPLNLSLQRTPRPCAHAGADHFGIEALFPDTVAALHERLEAAGLIHRREPRVTCCYALQDKVWTHDTDGHRWEVYHVLADAEVHSGAELEPSQSERPDDEHPAAACCEPSCCR